MSKFDRPIRNCNIFLYSMFSVVIFYLSFLKWDSYLCDKDTEEEHTGVFPDDLHI
jgi:hypothetical protein